MDNWRDHTKTRTKMMRNSDDEEIQFTLEAHTHQGILEGHAADEDGDYTLNVFLLHTNATNLADSMAKLDAYLSFIANQAGLLVPQSDATNGLEADVDADSWNDSDQEEELAASPASEDSEEKESDEEEDNDSDDDDEEEEDEEDQDEKEDDDPNED